MNGEAFKRKKESILNLKRWVTSAGLAALRSGRE